LKNQTNFIVLAFTFVMGKLNVAKMANFMEIDVFVLVASPENTLIDSKVLDFFILFQKLEENKIK